MADDEFAAGTIEDASALFASLDAHAGACRTAFDASQSATTAPPCQDFLALLDGEEVALYLEDCAALRRWRDDFIATPTAGDATAEQLASDLQRLRDVEFYCGKDALSKRTEHVQAAFNLIRGGQNGTGGDGGLAAGALEYERALRRLRDSGTGNAAAQRRRVENETERLWNELELELLRQRIERQTQFR